MNRRAHPDSVRLSPRAENEKRIFMTLESMDRLRRRSSS